MKRSLVLVVITAALFCEGAGRSALAQSPPQLISRNAIPKGLSASDWQGIRTAYQAHRHQTVPTPLAAEAIAQQAYLKASNTDTGDTFSGVAVSGDTVVVGAPGEASKATGINGDQNDNSATRAGAAYVFVRNGTTWTQQAYLKASNTDTGDTFSGVAV